MNGIVVAIVRWPGRWACWNLNRGDNGRMNRKGRSGYLERFGALPE